MKLYNTKTKKLESVPNDPGFYCCGPTVYGPAHIGNFRTFVVQDLFRRVLESNNQSVLHVRNITDVDDKTIKNSIEQGQTLKEFTDHWLHKFQQDCRSLNLLPPTHEPSAVEHIPEQISLIQNLVANKAAYVTDDGSVYFKISSFDDYGTLASITNQVKSSMQSQDDDEYDKDNITDFALWKSKKSEDGDNYWDSPWGAGRPGWHTECTAMALKICGKKLDVHSGGIDLLFPHHENETAQAVCATGHNFFKHWFHVEHLLVDGKKMSKSLGNLYTLSDLKEKGFSEREVRLTLLTGHYRKQLNFTFESLHSARKTLSKVDECHQLLIEDFDSANTEEKDETLEEARKQLLNDLDTPNCLRLLLAGLKNKPSAGKLKSLTKLLFALGLEPAAKEDIPQAVIKLAKERQLARQKKDWGKSDELRDEILRQGYEVKDTADGFKINPKN